MCLLLSLSLFLLAGCGGGGGGGGGGSSTSPPSVASADPDIFERGTAHTSSGLRVAALTGTWHEMGRQYGSLFKQQMTDFYNFARGATGTDYNGMAATAEVFYESLPSYLQDLVQGMAETSGASLEQQRIVASLPYQLYFPACSILSAWGRLYGRRAPRHRPKHGLGRVLPSLATCLMSF